MINFTKQHPNIKLANNNFKFFVVSFFIILNLLVFNINTLAQNPNNNNIYQAPQTINKPLPIAPKPNYAPTQVQAVPNNIQPPAKTAPTPAVPTPTSPSPSSTIPNQPTPNNINQNSATETNNLSKNDYFKSKISQAKPKKRIIKKNNPKKIIQPKFSDPFKENPNLNFEDKPKIKENSYELNQFEDEPQKPFNNRNKKPFKNPEIESKKFYINPENYNYQDEQNAKWLSYDQDNMTQEKSNVIDKNKDDDFNKKYNDIKKSEISNKNESPNLTQNKITPKINNHQIKLAVENLKGEFVFIDYENLKIHEKSKNKINNLLLSKIELENHFFSRIFRANLSFAGSLNSSKKSKYTKIFISESDQITAKDFSTSSNNFKELNFLSSFQIFKDYLRFNLGYKYNNLKFDESNYLEITSSNLINSLLDTNNSKNPAVKNHSFNVKSKIPFIGIELKVPVIPNFTNLKISTNYSNKASIDNKIFSRTDNKLFKTNFKNAKFFNLGIEIENKITQNLTLNLNYNLQRINLIKSKIENVESYKLNSGLSSKFSTFGLNLGYNF